jgi:flagellar biosynthesis protein
MRNRRSAPQAVALGYDKQRDRAPRVLAKGSGPIAAKIIQTAREHGVPLVADPVAGELLGQAALGAEIAPEFYRAVAEILAFVYRLEANLKKT